MYTRDFDYELPEDLVAQIPLAQRDQSRMLVIDKHSGLMEHHFFHELCEFVRPGDLIVLNNSKVIPARIMGVRAETGGSVEIMLLRRVETGIWSALVRPGRTVRAGTKISVQGQEIHVLEDWPDGERLLFVPDESLIREAGEMPLPPYIHQPLVDRSRYQTIYAQSEGSVAAPTAGLHFTEEMLEKLIQMGVRLTWVTLHIGLDTFRPVEEENPRDHKIHSEYFEFGEDVAEQVRLAHQERRRVICVGTTAVRVLEQVAMLADASKDRQLRACSGWADIFILPGHKFKLVDGMLTNFHMPKSTLLMLVSAFATRSIVEIAYREAIDKKYRFYSFGDCMLLI